MRPLRLKVIAHETSRSGASVVLLELLRYVRDQTPWSVHIDQLRGGCLAGEFAHLHNHTFATAAQVDAVLVNSSSAAPVLLEEDSSMPAIVYVHEDEEGLAGLTRGSKHALVDRADLVLCVSEGARSGLVSIGVPAERLHVLAPVVANRPLPSADAVDTAREILGGNDDTKVVVACGEAAWHKGPDLFIDVARRMPHQNDVRFVWIGRRPRGLGRVLDLDIEALELSHRVAWMGETEDPAPFLAAADVLVSTSRRDAQPLAPLEAALNSTPTVSFDVGGLAEFAAAGATVAVPYPDTEAFAESTDRLLEDSSMGRVLVGHARNLIEGTRRIETIGPRFAELVEQAVNTSDSPAMG